MEQRSLFGLSEHLERLSEHGDPLEVLEATVDFEYFRGWLVEGLTYGDGSKGGRPPFDPVSMFQGADSAGAAQSERREDGVHDPGPTILDALPSFRPWRADAGREHDPAFPQQANRDRHAAASDEGLRLATAEEGLHPDVGPDCRRLSRASPKQIPWAGRLRPALWQGEV